MKLIRIIKRKLLEITVIIVEAGGLMNLTVWIEKIRFDDKSCNFHDFLSNRIIEGSYTKAAVLTPYLSAFDFWHSLDELDVFSSLKCLVRNSENVGSLFQTWIYQATAGRNIKINLEKSSSSQLKFHVQMDQNQTCLCLFCLETESKTI